MYGSNSVAHDANPSGSSMLPPARVDGSRLGNRRRHEEQIDVVVVVNRQAELLEVVLATHAAGRLRLLHRRQKHATSTPIMAMTTNSSTNVKPARRSDHGK